MKVLKSLFVFFARMPHEYITGAPVIHHCDPNYSQQSKFATELTEEKEYNKNLCLYLSFVDPFYESFLPQHVQDKLQDKL
tara:strand:- start:235 stop:474 length:240 start_codon:yes stop_codon:yes gene_type:complete